MPKTTKHLLVDLDGTLYRSAKLFDDVRKNINGEDVSVDRTRARKRKDCVVRSRIVFRETTGRSTKPDPLSHLFPPPPPPQPT